MKNENCPFPGLLKQIQEQAKSNCKAKASKKPVKNSKEWLEGILKKDPKIIS